jgi:hypothetical protein
VSAIGGVGAAWKPALDKVWEFLRTQPGLRTEGPNVFLYHHPTRRDQPTNVDVEMSRAFEPAGEVFATETPAGMVVVASHVGAYDRMKETHDAIHAWGATNKRAFRKVMGDLRRLVGRSVENRDDNYVCAHIVRRRELKGGYSYPTSAHR